MAVTLLATETEVVLAVFKLSDAFAPGRNLQGRIDILLDGKRYEQRRTPEEFIAIIGLPAGEYAVTIDAEFYDLYEPTVIDTAALTPLSAAVPLTLRPNPDYRFPERTTLLRGIVTDDADAPLAGVQILVQSGGADEVAFTDAAGRYVLSFEIAVPTQAITLRFARTGYITDDGVALLQSGQSIVVDAMLAPIPAGVAVIATTVFDLEGAPINNALVEALEWSLSANTNAQGFAVISKAIATPTQNVQVRLSKSAYVTQTNDVVAVRDDALNLAPTLLPIKTATLTGTITGPSGELVTQCLVESLTWGTSVNANVNGVYSIAYDIDTTPQNVSLRFTQAGFAVTTQNVVAQWNTTTVANASLALNILAITGQILVRVRHGGSPVAGALITIASKGRSALSNAAGEFRFYFNDVPPGGQNISISVSKSGYQTKVQDTFLTQGDTDTETFNIVTV